MYGEIKFSHPSVSNTRSTVANGLQPFPYEKRITMNLAPADDGKCGASADLWIALGKL